ncbi:MAG: PSD1 and planctomycete cytochrome C domain-containing protein [Planctomycetota bacterium]|nr:PSD1 and planctomycete cytochrome C domain-containing protein [Planctomycetota bacterium]MDA1249823.1 PSD1 and planctomycete cytochrome C domain-containing protein [Planctomycetota bacterium]
MFRTPWPMIVFALSGSFIVAAFAQDDGEQTENSPNNKASSEVSAIDFEKHVQPILSRHCLKCHGPKEQQSGLRLDRRSSLLRGGDIGEPAIVPGKSAESFLIKVVSGTDPDVTMPPEGDRLSKKEVDTLRAWIDQGAKTPGGDDGKLTTDHWSFQPISKAAPPNLDTPFISSPLDAFVLQTLTEKNLKPSTRADRRTLIRRLFFVMHGLPPTREQTRRFIEDNSPGAWETLVDEVLESPRYGERWARHWLDLVRFGETHGFETNRERPNAWPYRDYVISSLNDNKPYDQFVREQIAGDALGADVATGFLVAGPHDIVKSQDINLTLMQRQDELADLINATGTTFLGLTFGCARCHNHKFDSITQRDYYSIQAVFAGVNHADRTLPISPKRAEQLKQVETRVATLRTRLAQFIPRPADNSKLRPAVTAKLNVEEFEPVAVKFVRFTIEATNASQPCIDELEVFSGDKNVALASLGVKPTSSSNLPGYEIHKLVHINDGQIGNGRSWISNENGGWVQLEFPQPVKVDRIVWARDRQGRFSDRVATKYRIEAAVEPGQWQTIASSADRTPFSAKPKSDEPTYDFEAAPPELAKQGKAWFAELATLKKQQADLSATPVVYAGTFGQPGPTYRLYRGDPLARREEVTPDTLEVISSLGLERNAPEQERRRRFAEWITSPDNPLAARVIVNRIWQHHFGTGLVDTPSDFGANGTQPTHPELLDWLARDLINNSWSLKHVHRLILMSSTWQQDSQPRKDAAAIDASSRLLWRFPPRRLEAEAIRDNILATTGVLDLKMGGPGFSGFEVQMENVRHFFPKTSYGPGDWRRMIYMTKVRQEQESVFGAFDCPDASQVTASRSRSTTPLQALNLLNSTFVLQQAKLFAERLEKESPAADIRRAALAMELAFGRTADADETAAAFRFATDHGWPALCRALLNSNEFLFIP